jgi:hypothetical protein
MIAVRANQARAEPTGRRAYIEGDQNSLVSARKTSLAYMGCASSPGSSANALRRWSGNNVPSRLVSQPDLFIKTHATAHRSRTV